jgi:hypothetical protein
MYENVYFAEIVGSFLFLRNHIYDNFCTLPGLVLVAAVPPGHMLVPTYSLGGPLPPPGGGQHRGNVDPKLTDNRVVAGGVFSTGVGTEKDPPSESVEAPPQYSTG